MASSAHFAQSSALQIVAVPCLRDNYSYLVTSLSDPGSCLIIDACESGPILAEVERRQLTPLAVLSTHHHHDHVGGNQALVERFGVPVYGHHTERQRIVALSHGLEDGQTFTVGPYSLSALFVPGHTRGALAYLIEGHCFTGDTLFCGGCGRLFEGSPEQMHHSLSHVLAALPESTLLYTGHEYTESNLRFAQSVLFSPETARRLDEVLAARKTGQCTAIASLLTEKRTNLFLRCHDDVLQQGLWQDQWDHLRESLEPEELALRTFTRLRQLKDRA